ncbi:MAG: sigma-70 family RNA polymerase sigma factor [Verrucomicrobiota bacterium]|nr:sigma-70 family RNA polymerase sigma factor [Verrucomicrobiota bacterium]
MATPNHDHLPDTELMRLVQRGRQQAFVALVRRHQNALLNFFRAMGVGSDAEDMAQDTFARLFNYRKRYKPTAKFTTFLYLLARQVRIDGLRKNKRYAGLMEGFAREREVREDTPRAPRTSGYDLDAALASLPETMRSVVVLNVCRGLKYEEVAEALEIPLGTVKSRMFVALRKLKELLDEQKTQRGEAATKC